ncbi:MAG: HAMP domain-containing histidine kinase [Elusimicrobia bacterium]|nr:HAMP domain-containing histidine kinase [Elusimicrobiota bacterium]
MRIRTKFSLFTCIVIFISVFSIAIVTYLLQKKQIEDDFLEERGHQLSSFAEVCRQALVVNDELFMIHFVQLFHNQPSVMYAYYVTDADVVLAHSDTRFVHKDISEWSGAKPGGAIETSVRIQDIPEKGGRVVMGFSEEYQRTTIEEALRRTLRRVVTAALLVLGVGLTAALWLTYLLTRPIRKLVWGSDQIGKGNFQTEIQVDSHDELGDLAKRFNSMARNLSVLDEMKDQFISTVSHDLRLPLSAIMMHVDYMLNMGEMKNSLTAEYRDMLIRIVDNAMRLNIFVSNVLDAAKIKAGFMEYHPKPVRFEAAARRIQTLYGIVAKQKGITLVADIPTQLPAVHVDPERFDHVVANLVSNALKYTPKEGLVTLSAREGAEGVEACISDTGIGIAPEDVPRLFEPFYQAQVAEQRAKGKVGTGLGLYIVKKTVEDMGGSIRVESEKGAGTRFVLTFPAIKEESQTI